MALHMGPTQCNDMPALADAFKACVQQQYKQSICSGYHMHVHPMPARQAVSMKHIRLCIDKQAT